MRVASKRALANITRATVRLSRERLALTVQWSRRLDSLTVTRGKVTTIMIHGSTEILAILLAGGAGLRIGLAALFPGEQTRMDSLRAAGRIGGTAMVGVVLMLLIAGFIEGVGRQTITGLGPRLAIGGGMLALWAFYFLYAGRSDADR